MSYPAYQKVVGVLLLVWLGVTLAQTSIGLKDGETPDGKAVYISSIVGAIALCAVGAVSVWGYHLYKTGQMPQGVRGGYGGLSAASFY